MFKEHIVKDDDTNDWLFTQQSTSQACPNSDISFSYNSECKPSTSQTHISIKLSTNKANQIRLCHWGFDWALVFQIWKPILDNLQDGKMHSFKNLMVKSYLESTFISTCPSTTCTAETTAPLLPAKLGPQILEDPVQGIVAESFKLSLQTSSLSSSLAKYARGIYTMCHQSLSSAKTAVPGSEQKFAKGKLL